MTKPRAKANANGADGGNASNSGGGNANDSGEISGQSAILQAIDTLRTEKIEEKAEMQKDELAKQISGLRDELMASIDQANNRVGMLDERTASLEEAVNMHSNKMADLEQQVVGLKKELEGLLAKTEDLEARSRRCNLRIFGVKEGQETGARVSTYVAELLQYVFKLDTEPVIDRAHCTLQKTPDKGHPPRAFVVKCHYYQEKDAILRKALASQRLVSKDGDTVRVFPDYTHNVARQRAAFIQAKQLLRQCEGVKYGLLYPAKLKITTGDGEQKMFTDPMKATTFARGLLDR
uniref:L1 transposable element RRM domain-containing protein n=1 Tax=Knipowitschia caucasica TaxID=637954 RepID=A0AAV2KVU7_KNICA